MRFMMIINGNADYEAGLPPPSELIADMAKLSEELTKSGALIVNAGLQPSAKGSRIELAGGKRRVIDGPFAEAKEVIGGFAIVEARSKYEAMALAQRVVDIHVDAGIKDFQMEIRPLYEHGDCGNAQSIATEASCAS